MSPELKDFLGKRFVFEKPFTRIVSLVPSSTETLFEIGAGEKVIGVTSFCIHPKEGVKKKIKVGGTKNLKIQIVVDANPDLIVANIEENTKEDIEELQSKGLNVFVTHPRNCEDSIAHIRGLGMLTGCEKAAEILARAQEEALLRLPHRSKIPTVLYLIWKNPYMTINKDTYVHSLIENGGGKNPFGANPKRYPEISLEDIHCVNPDAILLPSEPYHFKETDREELLRDSSLKAAKKGNIFLINGEDTCWFGPRMGKGLLILSEIFEKVVS